MWARKIVAAHEHHSAAGAGAFVVDGDMIDMPTVKQAMRTLARTPLDTLRPAV